MKHRVRMWIAWCQQLLAEYQRARVSLFSGGMAYFVALSLAPAALAFGAIAGLFIDPQELQHALDRIAEQAPGTIGNVQPLLDSVVSMAAKASAGSFTITTVVSILIAVYAASKIVFMASLTMNTIFGVSETRGGAMERLLSAVATLAGIVLAVAVVLLLTFVPRVLEWFGVTDVRLTSGSWLIDWSVALVLVYLASRAILRRVPSRSERIPWRSPGALIATVGIAAATIGVGVYAKLSSSLGAAVLVFGTAIVILLWLYLCFLALLWGAIVEADAQRRRDRAVTSATSDGENV